MVTGEGSGSGPIGVTTTVTGSTPPVTDHVVGPYHLKGTVADRFPTEDKPRPAQDMACGARFPMMPAVVKGSLAVPDPVITRIRKVLSPKGRVKVRLVGFGPTTTVVVKGGPPGVTSMWVI